jgi:pilus assembly protein Flp/PilA
MRNLIIRFARCESGATSIEYGLIAAGISIALITLVGQLGDELQTLFGKLKDDLMNFNGTAG